MIKLSELKKWAYLLFFFPLYLNMNGIYQASNVSGNISEGLVLSWLYILSSIIILKIVYGTIITKNIFLKREYINIFVLLLIVIFFIIVQTLIGYLYFNTLTIFIINGQFLASMTGIIIAFYFFEIEKYSFDEIIFNISLLFLFAAVSNLIVSIDKIGVANTFGRSIWPSTLFGGIYHHFIYYPYLVSLIFLFALPIWFKKIKGYVIFIYLFILFYILLFQVRGAIISYSIGLAIFAIYYLGFKFKYILYLTLSSLVFILFIPKSILIGRFFESPIEMISHRTGFLSTFITNILTSPSYLLIGSLSKSLIYKIPKNQFSGIFSLHNQYLNLIDNYGMLIVAFLIFVLFFYFRYIIQKINAINDKSISRKYIFWTLIITLSLSIDLNINEQLTTANPGIYMFFIYSSIFFSI